MSLYIARVTLVMDSDGAMCLSLMAWAACVHGVSEAHLLAQSLSKRHTYRVSCVCVQLLSHVQLFVTPWIAACQAPPSMEFSRQFSRWPFPTPGYLPDSGIKPMSLASPVFAGGFFTPAPPGKPIGLLGGGKMCLADGTSHTKVFIYKKPQWFLWSPGDTWVLRVMMLEQIPLEITLWALENWS